MRYRRFCNERGTRERLLLWCSNPRRRIEPSLKNVSVPLLPRFRCLQDYHSSKTSEKLEGLWSLAGREQIWWSDDPMQIDQAVAGSTCIAESSTHITLPLYTRVGPALLRGHLVLVILEDVPAICRKRSTQGTRNRSSRDAYDQTITRTHSTWTWCLRYSEHFLGVRYEKYVIWSRARAAYNSNRRWLLTHNGLITWPRQWRLDRNR